MNAREALASPMRTRFALALLALGACAPTPAPPPPALATTELLALYRARDYFALRHRLQGLAGVRAPELGFLRAALWRAMNRPERSLAVADSTLAADDLPDSLRMELVRIQIGDDRSLFRYGDAARRVAGFLAEFPHAPAAVLDDARNSRRMLDALRDVPPQTMERRGPTRLVFDEHGFISVAIDGVVRRLGFDTGAGLSVLLRSEARALGMRIRPVGLDVGSSTARHVTADLAVADSLRIGGLLFHHVVFLVLDDSLLTVGSFRIPGLVGFPVIEQMGEVRVLGRDTLEVPERVPARTEANLALEGRVPLTPVVWRGDTLVCKLDSGADRTQFYEPFLRRHRAQVERTGRLGSIKFAGAGGTQKYPAYWLRDVRLAVGDTSIVIDSTSVLTRSIVQHEEDDYADCNLGHDVLDALHGYVIDFRDMAFLLR